MNIPWSESSEVESKDSPNNANDRHCSCSQPGNTPSGHTSPSPAGSKSEPTGLGRIDSSKWCLAVPCSASPQHREAPDTSVNPGPVPGGPDLQRISSLGRPFDPVDPCNRNDWNKMKGPEVLQYIVLLAARLSRPKVIRHRSPMGTKNNLYYTYVHSHNIYIIIRT